MKAVVVRAFAPFDEIELGELPDPTPGPGQAVIDVKAADVNYPDILVIAGQYQFKPPLPFSPGKAAAGIVSAVGPGVQDVRVGDRVSVQVEYGAYAEKLLAPAVNVYRLPPDIDFVSAAALGLTYQTAHFALVERARMQPNDIVLVLGASGGIGYAAVQLARALGAKIVIAGARGAEKAALARQAGATATIELSGSDLHERLRAEVAAITGGHGVDIVIDPVGGPANAAALRAMAWRGRMVIAGFTAGIPTIKGNYLLVRNIEASGLQWSDYRDRTPEWVADVQEQLFSLFREAKIRPHVSRTFSLGEFKNALAVLRGGHVMGKIVLMVA